MLVQTGFQHINNMMSEWLADRLSELLFWTTTPRILEPVWPVAMQLQDHVTCGLFSPVALEPALDIAENSVLLGIIFSPLLRPSVAALLTAFGHSVLQCSKGAKQSHANHEMQPRRS